MRKALGLWLLGWAFFGLPWTTFTTRPAIHRIRLWIFRRTRPRDVILNFAYYVPFGLIAVSLAWPPAVIVPAAAALSGATELMQVFSTDRVPSVTDLLLNIAGALAGVVIGLLLPPRDRSR